MKENKNYKSICSIAIIMTVIALSIGNIINIRSITVYKVVSLLLPFLFIYYLVRTKRKFYWSGFFTLMGIFILANLCMFGIISNPHLIRQKHFLLLGFADMALWCSFFIIFSMDKRLSKLINTSL